ncbi:MAG: substrate-binding domain-containing protein [Nitrospirae bacterium]|nr:substrate-binding domain-containing protein [Nitrospirota bacterium]
MRAPSRSAVLTVPSTLSWIVLKGLLLALIFAWTAHAQDSLTGRIVIAGYGPELPVLQDLARAFEKHAPGTAIDFNWDNSVRAVELVKRGEAQIAVSDQPSTTLSHTQIAWDGIAVIVNFANPIKEVTTSQVRALLTGQIIRVLSAVSGHDTAVTYLSLNAALKAQEDGIPIRILTIDQVEAGEPTVHDGRYKLRRPVLLLSAPRPDPVTSAFLAFTLSPEGQQLVRSMFTSIDSAASPANVQRTDPLIPSS